jgi:hypothetical protein
MRTLLIPLSLILLLSLTYAQEGAPVTVTVRGEATVLNGDVPAAREEALVDAQRNALEQVLGVQIEAETAVQDFMLADDTILSMISGFVKDSKILSEKQEMEFLVLEVECSVVKELSEAEAQQLMRNFSCIVGFTMELDGERVENDNRLTNKLISELVKADYDVRDASQLLSIEGFNGMFLRAAEKEDVKAARWIGQQMLSNVVIVGHAKLKLKEKKEVSGFAGSTGVFVYDCWMDARAIEAESGQIIAQFAAPLEGIQGTGSNEDKAITDALVKAEKPFLNDLMSQLTAYAGRKSRPITILINGIPSYDEFLKVKQYLKNVRFRDSEVSDLGFEQGQTSTFRFNYSEKMNLIALKMEHLPSLTVVERTENKVTCRYFREL